MRLQGKVAIDSDRVAGIGEATAALFGLEGAEAKLHGVLNLN